MWQDARYFPREQSLAPTDNIMSFRFTIPSTELNTFRNHISESPRLLEAILLSSPYGELMYVKGGKVLRNQANRLLMLDLPTGIYHAQEYGREAERITKTVKNGTAGTTVPINPPVGETVK